MSKLIILGNGVAGVTTARLVAERDPARHVALYGQEPYPYYPRPRLIDLLSGRLTPEGLTQYGPEWYQQRGIHLHLGCRATGIDAAKRQVRLDDGSTADYDDLVLATGASSWVPPINGADHPCVHTLRTRDDATAIQACAAGTHRAVVLGGGLLGLDTAVALSSESLRSDPLQVTVVEALPRLLPRQLDVEGAGLLAELVAAKGIRVIVDDQCASITDGPLGACVTLKSGIKLDAGLVIVSTGVRANLQLAQQAGLACQRGIVVDEQMRTSDPHIYAVGDVAEFQERVWAIIPTAIAQARVAAAQLVGETDTRYAEVAPSTTLQVTGIDLTSIGLVNPDGQDCTELRTIDREQGIYKKLVLRDGRIVGAIVLGDRSDIRVISQLMAAGTDVSAHAHELLSAGFGLKSLLA